MTKKQNKKVKEQEYIASNDKHTTTTSTHIAIPLKCHIIHHRGANVDEGDALLTSSSS